MTAVEKFHFGVEKYFIHTFQLPMFGEDMKCRKCQKKKKKNRFTGLNFYKVSRPSL